MRCTLALIFACLLTPLGAVTHPAEPSAAELLLIQNMVTQLNAADQPKLNALLDSQGLHQRIMRHVSDPSASPMVDDAVAGFCEAFWTGTLQQLEQGARVHIPHMVERNRERCVKLRTIMPSGDVQIALLLLNADRQQPRIIDSYQIGLLSFASDIIADTLLPSINPGDQDTDTIAAIKSVQSMTSHIQAGGHAEAYALWESLEAQQIKFGANGLYLALNAASKLGDDTMTNCLAAVEAAGHSDRIPPFMLLDHYVLSEQYPLAIAAIDRAIGDVGHCAYLLTLRGSIALAAGATDAAARDAYQAIVMEDLVDAYDLQVSIALALGDFSAAADAQREIYRLFDIHPDYLVGDERAAAYCASSAYRELVAALPPPK